MNQRTAKPIEITPIRSESELVAVLKDYLNRGLSLSEMTYRVNKRGVVCYAAGIQLLIQKHNLK